MDKDENPRIVLSADRKGTARLVFSGEGADARTILEALPNGRTALRIYEKGGRGKCTFGVDPDGTPMLALYGSKPGLGCSLGILPDDTATLLFKDKKGRPRSSMGTYLPTGDPYLALRGPDMNSRIMMYAHDSGELGVELWDKHRKPQASMKILPDGRTVISPRSAGK